MADFKDMLKELRIIPVLTVGSEQEALETCQALHAGGIKAVEITLRTDAGLRSLAAVKKAMPEFRVGAGTVKTTADLEAVAKSGVDFAVSPGLSAAVVQRASTLGVPILPGVATATELMTGLELGCRCFKLFPAQAVGGIGLLKSLAAPFAEAMFCPTGGISGENFRDYLALPNVVCVGGSWMVTRELIESGNWSEISRLSQECMQ